MFSHHDELFFLTIIIPANNKIIPTAAICKPYEIQSGLEYMNDDSGPIADWPWRWNVVPKIPVMMPVMAMTIPFFMIFSYISIKKG